MCLHCDGMCCEACIEWQPTKNFCQESKTKPDTKPEVSVSDLQSWSGHSLNQTHQSHCQKKTFKEKRNTGKQVNNITSKVTHNFARRWEEHDDKKQLNPQSATSFRNQPTGPFLRSIFYPLTSWQVMYYWMSFISNRSLYPFWCP